MISAHGKWRLRVAATSLCSLACAAAVAQAQPKVVSAPPVDPRALLRSAEQRVSSIERTRFDRVKTGASLDALSASLKEAERELQLAQRPPKGAPAPPSEVAAARARLLAARDVLRVESASVWAGPLGFGAEELAPVWLYLDPKVQAQLEARVASVKAELRAVAEPAKKASAASQLRELTVDPRGGSSPHFRVAGRARNTTFEGDEPLKKACARASKPSLLWRKRTLEAVLRRGLALSNERLMGLAEEGEEGMAGTLEELVNAQLAEIQGLKSCKDELAVEAPAGAVELTTQVVAARLEAFAVRDEALAYGSGKLDFGRRKAAAAEVTRFKNELKARLGRGAAAQARHRASPSARPVSGVQGLASLEAARVEYQAAVTAGGKLLEQLRQLRQIEAEELEALERQRSFSARTEAALALARMAATQLRAAVNEYLRKAPPSPPAATSAAILEAKANAALADSDVKTLTKMAQARKTTLADNVQRSGFGAPGSLAARRAEHQKSDALVEADVSRAKRLLGEVDAELERSKKPRAPAAPLVNAPAAGCDIRKVDWQNFVYDGVRFSGGSASTDADEAGMFVTRSVGGVLYGDVSGDRTPEALVTLMIEMSGHGPASTLVELHPYRLSKECVPTPVPLASDKPMLPDPYDPQPQVSYLSGAFRIFDGNSVHEWKMKGDKLTLVSSFVPGD